MSKTLRETSLDKLQSLIHRQIFQPLCKSIGRILVYVTLIRAIQEIVEPQNRVLGDTSVVSVEINVVKPKSSPKPHAPFKIIH